MPTVCSGDKPSSANAAAKQQDRRKDRQQIGQLAACDEDELSASGGEAFQGGQRGVADPAIGRQSAVVIAGESQIVHALLYAIHVPGTVIFLCAFARR